MRYVVAKTKTVTNAGISDSGHRTKKGFIIINEKEIMNSDFLEGDFEARVQILGGTTYTNVGINNIINEGGWNYGL